MKITLKITKTVQENAARYYEEAKQARKKIEGLEKAIAETQKEIEKTHKAARETEQKIQRKKEKKWYEKFHWFFTTNGKLAVGGKSAQQNDQLFAKHMEDTDLFFHADIQGGSVFILKEGVSASLEEQREVAQAAASFSSAWKNANASVNVYAVKKEQLSKHVSGGYVPTGGFAIQGEREWFKAISLGLKIGKGETGIEIVPPLSKRHIENARFLYPDKSGKEKGALAKIIAKQYGVSVDDILAILPNGKSKIESQDNKR